MDLFQVPQLSLSKKRYQLSVPSSKSLANRALILAAQIEGEVFLEGDFAAEDIQLMKAALMQLGIEIEEQHTGLLVRPEKDWLQDNSQQELYIGNSGTSIRFLTALLSQRLGPTVLTGKERMKERPIRDLVDPLRSLGAEVRYLENEGYPPLQVQRGRDVGSSELSVQGSVSSQYLTALLMACLLRKQITSIRIEGELISRPYIQMTVDLIHQWGGKIDSSAESFVVHPSVLQMEHYRVEGDASAATYWWALGLLHGVEVEVDNLPLESLQGDSEFKTLLQALRERVQGEGVEISSEETVFDLNDMPDASLTLMALAPLLNGPIRIVNIGSLRVKETDRLAAMATELQKVGVRVHEGDEEILIFPLDVQNIQNDDPVYIDTYDDHRIAMSFAVLGTRLGNLIIRDPDCVHKTYPSFWRDLERVFVRH